MIPGPKYILPPLTGYDFHDVTHVREPAYSLGVKLSTESHDITPGPKYAALNMTRHGVFETYSAVITSRHDAQSKYDIKPSPLSNSPEKHEDPSFKTVPGWYFGTRPSESLNRNSIPGPKYSLPQIVAANPIDKPNVPAWYMGGRSAFYTEGKKVGPGPGRYGAPNLETFKTKSPCPTMAGRHYSHHDIKPGPKYFGDYKKTTREPPAWYFGIRHSKKQLEVRTPLDDGVLINL